MASNKPPNIVVQALRGSSIPGGYLLGRASGGTGAIELLTLAQAKAAGLAPATLPPSGSAGGDLSGTYPNPTVSGLQTRAVSSSPPSNLDVLAWNSGGSAWASLHLGAAAYTNSYLDLSNLPPLTGGTTGQVLTKISNTSYDFGWATPAGSSGAPASIQDDGTNIYIAMSDTNGQLVLDGSGNPIFSLEVFPPASIPNIAGYASGPYSAVVVNKVKGVTDGSDATAGDDGEVISSTVLIGSAVALTDGVVANIASIILTPGDWDVNIGAGFTGGATTTTTLVAATIHTTNNALANIPGSQFQQPFPGGQAIFNVQDFMTAAGPRRFSVSVNTTIYFNVYVRFAVSTCSAYGIIRARRIR